MQLCRVEIVRHLGNPVLGQVGRRGAKQPAIRRDVLRDDARVRRCAEADADVEGVVRERRRIHRQLQLHLDLRVLADEAGDQRRHVDAPEPQRRVHPQQALRRGLGHAKQLLHVVDLAEDAAGMLQVELALGSEAHAPRGPVHEGQADPRLHQRQVLAHRGRRDAQLARGGTQAASAREHGEEPQVSRLNSAGHLSLRPGSIVRRRLMMDSL